MKGKGFLKHMVRRIVGLLVEAAPEKPHMKSPKLWAQCSSCSSDWWFGNVWNIFIPDIGNVFIPTDFLDFFGGVAQPPTSRSKFHPHHSSEIAPQLDGQVGLGTRPPWRHFEALPLHQRPPKAPAQGLWLEEVETWWVVRREPWSGYLNYR